ncbi:MAG: hypothetical protein HDT15_10685, partial [Oscillibacter sp.]|nr:hypothetical protein [Oscillibacter sp.]
NGEFEGKGWEYQTAAKAKEIGLIDNVIEAQLGSAASREMVAEILFRAMLGEMVSYTALNGYVGTGKTLGKEKFGLESVTGVVVANKWANLTDEGSDQVLNDGKTQMVLADGTTRTLDIDSSLEVVGLTCTAYMADQDNNNVLEVLTDELTADAVNVVADNEGKATGTNEADQVYSSIRNLAGTKGISVTSDTESYWNYDKWVFTTSDILIRYAVVKGTSVDGVNINDYAASIQDGTTTTVGHSAEERRVNVNGDSFDCWVISIKPNHEIEAIDQAFMRQIFYTADRLAYVTDANLALNDYVIGEVYVGTTSTVDVSDTLSWVQFKDKYLVENNNGDLGWVYNGQSLRVVDNNGDGTAEYILGIGYVQTRIVNIRNDVPEFYNIKPGEMGYKDIYWDGGVEAYSVNTVVNYSVIDNKMSVWTAPVVTDSAKTKNFQKITVTTTDSGETYGQSGIVNATTMDYRILSMDEGVKYNMYLDQFGFIRTYEPAVPTQYAVLTEMYGGAVQHSNYVSSTTAIAELTIGDEVTKEYTVNNAASSVFLSRVGTSELGAAIAWTMGTGLATYQYNWLQPAVAHLMGQGQNPADNNYSNYGNIANTSSWYTVWGRQVWKPEVLAVKGTVLTTPAMFDYGPETWDNNGTPATAANSYSLTNVAAYTLKDDGTVDLKSASTYAVDQNGYRLYYVTTTRTARNQNMDKVTAATWDTAKYGKTFQQAYDAGELAPVYATDYVQLTKDDVSANQRLFNIDEDYAAKFTTNSNGYVNATVNTEFYVVTSGGVKHYVGYAGLPTILGANIRAAYAVATNTSVGSNTADYWVADVIVIETNKVEQAYDSISLRYWNPSETQGQTRLINTLNNEWKGYGSNDLAKMQVVPAGTSWGNWALGTGYGFYELYNTEFNADTNTLTAGSVKQIAKGEYNDHGIFAGALRRDAIIEETSGYVSVNILGNWTNSPSDSKWIKNIDLDAPANAYSAPVYHVQYGQYAWQTGETFANEIRLARAQWTDVRPGDALIWVLDKATNTAFVVDVTDHADEGATPAWLATFDANGVATGGIYKDILDEQLPGATTGYTITVKSKGLPTEKTWTYTVPVNGDQEIDLTQSIFLEDNYYISSATPAAGAYPAVGPTLATVTQTKPASTVTAIKLAGVQGDIDVELTYTLEQYDVKTIPAWTANTVGGVKVNDIKVNGNTITTSAHTTAEPVDVTKTATLTIDLNNPLATATQSVEVTVKKCADSSVIAALSGTATQVITDATGKTYTYTFTMPAYDVDVDVQVVENNPDVTVTPHLTATGNPSIDYSINTTPNATTGTAADGTAITAKKNNVITFTSNDKFFVGVGASAAAVDTVIPATKQADGTYAYPYTVGSANADLVFYSAVTVTVINRTDNNVPLTWNAAKMPAGGTLSGNTADNTYTVDVPYGCAWMTFTDPSNVMELKVDTAPTPSGVVNGANNSVTWSTVINAAVTLEVSTKP